MDSGGRYRNWPVRGDQDFQRGKKNGFFSQSLFAIFLLFDGLQLLIIGERGLMCIIGFFVYLAGR